MSEFMLETVPDDAVALRIVDTIDGSLYEYPAVTFPHNPLHGCRQMLRRAHYFHYIPGDEKSSSDPVIDVLGADGSILCDFSLKRSGLDFILSEMKLKRRVERLQEDHGQGK